MPKTKRVAGAVLDFYVEEDTATDMIFALRMNLQGSRLMWFMRREVEPHLKRRARGRFANEGDETVGSWAPLKESTQSFREAMQDELDIGPDHPINIRTRELFGMATRGLYEVNWNDNSATLYAPGRPKGKIARLKLATAQVGDPARNTPARPVLGMGANDLVHILERLALHITTGVASFHGMATQFEAWDGD